MILRPVPRSPNIPIPNTKKAATCPAGCIHEPEQPQDEESNNELQEQQIRYDLATWRMYELIMNHRNNKNRSVTMESSFCVYCEPYANNVGPVQQRNYVNTAVKITSNQHVAAVPSFTGDEALDGEVFPIDL